MLLELKQTGFMDCTTSATENCRHLSVEYSCCTGKTFFYCKFPFKYSAEKKHITNKSENQKLIDTPKWCPANTNEEMR